MLLKKYETRKKDIYSIISNKDQIGYIFFQYGFITDNNYIIKHYAKTRAHGLLRIYREYKELGSEESETIESETDESEDPRNILYWKLVNIINNGYFTLDEYHQLLSHLLKDKNIELLSALTRPHIDFIRYHPRVYIFNKLIYRYIGISRLIERLILVYLVFCLLYINLNCLHPNSYTI